MGTREPTDGPENGPTDGPTEAPAERAGGYAAWSPDRGWHVKDTPGRVCPVCARAGRFTWLSDDGTCRRADRHG